MQIPSFLDNWHDINLLHVLEFEGRQATPEEQEILSRYVGWGGLADAFDENKSNWASEYQELKTLLSSVVISSPLKLFHVAKTETVLQL